MRIAGANSTPNLGSSFQAAAPIGTPTQDPNAYPGARSDQDALAEGGSGPVEGPGGATAAVALTGNADIDGVLALVRWNVGSLTYAFPASGADYGAGYPGNANNESFGQIFAHHRAAFHDALNTSTVVDGAGGAKWMAVEGFTNQTISYLLPTGNAMMRAAYSTDPASAYAYYPGANAGSSNSGGDSWYRLGTSYSYETDPMLPGSLAFLGTIHEIGHALGLKHGQEASNGNATVLPFDHNSLEYSVMTYRAYVGAPDNGSGWFGMEQHGRPQSWMISDIAALQHMYGADFTHNGGNTTYSWSPTTGQMFVDGAGQGQPGANRVFLSIWDGNGTDSYDLSNYTSNLEIDLTPGGHSDFNSGQSADLGGGPNGGFARGNVFNAYQSNNDPRSLIENANGGSGNDSIGGNSATNALNGNAGADTLNGVDGDDTLNGGNGADLLQGGFNADQLFGGADNDRLYAMLEANIAGSGVADLLDAAEGNDGLYGSGGSDTLLGGTGLDTLLGGAGGDSLNGGAGVDWATYDGATAGVRADLAEPGANTGDAAGDSYVGVENLHGSDHRDLLLGDGRANHLHGGDLTQADRLFGRGGNDTLEGSDGNDVLTGGNGADRHFGGAGGDFYDYNTIAELGTSGAARDVLSGFGSTDRIDLGTIDASASAAGNNAFVFNGTAAITAEGQIRAVQSGADTFLYINTQGTTAPNMIIQLLGISAGSVNAGDFLL